MRRNEGGFQRREEVGQVWNRLDAFRERVEHLLPVASVLEMPEQPDRMGGAEEHAPTGVGMSLRPADLDPIEARQGCDDCGSDGTCGLVERLGDGIRERLRVGANRGLDGEEVGNLDNACHVSPVGGGISLLVLIPDRLEHKPPGVEKRLQIDAGL